MSNNTLRVTWFVPPAIAVAASWKEPPGFHLESSRTQSSDEQYQLLCDGVVDAAVTSIDNVLHWNQRQGPEDFVVVAQMETTTPLHLIGSSTLSAPADLVGANILVDAPQNGFVIALRALLQQAGLGTGDYRLTPVGGVRERFSALIEGQGDATLLGPPFDTMAVQRGLKHIATIQDVFAGFPGQGLVVRRSVSHGNEALKTWIRMLQASLATVPGDTEKLKMALDSLDLPSEAVTALVNTFPSTLIPSRDGIELLIGQRALLGLSGANVTYEQIVDCSFLQSFRRPI
ncbi:ABC transporter substrate-binding protein [Pseudomonas sp. Pseusp11]|uniref:ABC transporter substrate-binding protein n=1 Tax=Pseudomonas sp. Pseusp11 TaxID=3243003 RepID=UPI0039B6CED7